MRGMMRGGRRMVWLAGVTLALSAVAVPLAYSQSIIEEWSQVKAPAPPALKAVRIDPASTALIVMDISVRTCSSAKRPRCAASLPAIASLVRKARASGVLVLYSLVGHDGRSDIPKAFAARPSDTVVTGAGPDKFVGSDLEAILKGKHIKTLITVGTSAEGAVLNTASGAVFRGFEVVVPVDGMSSDTLYGEQSTAWYLAHAPRVSQHAALTEVDRITF
ncbi:MAG: isochorismatase family protein [Gammaproteobacteria bacterium]|nr:isochorismatase family protein [Gammaproteobacteria bacterium]